MLQISTEKKATVISSIAFILTGVIWVSLLLISAAVQMRMDAEIGAIFQGINFWILAVPEPLVVAVLLGTLLVLGLIQISLKGKFGGVPFVSSYLYLAFTGSWTVTAVIFMLMKEQANLSIALFLTILYVLLTVVHYTVVERSRKWLNVWGYSPDIVRGVC